MKALVVGLISVLTAGGATLQEKALFDPDDQMRFIDELDYRVYDRLVADGFNTLVQSSHFSTLQVLDDPSANAYERSSARQFLEVLEKCEADRINFVENLPGWGHQMARFQTKYPILDRSGKPVEKGIEASNPEFLKEIAALSKIKAVEGAKLPRACVGASVACEVRAHTQPSHTPQQRARYQQDTGCEVPPEVDGRLPPTWKDLVSFPRDRVIDDEFPLYKYYRWFWTKGDGWNDYNSLITRQYAEAFGKRPHLTIYSPVLRAPQFWGSGGKISHSFDWSYANPSPIVIAQIAAEQQAMAREDGRGFLSMVQAICWRRDIAGPDSVLREKGIPLPDWTKEWPKTKFPTMPPDLVQEGLWMAWLHRSDGVGFHGWNSIYDGRPLGFQDGEDVYAFTHPGTQKVISNLFHTVGIPLGPYFKSVPERKPEVALLISAASELFGGDAAWDFRGKPHAYGMIAGLAGLSPYVIYDDEIARDGIPASVKVLLLRSCSVLVKTTYDALVAFQKRGGKILADHELAPALKASGELPLPAYSWENPKWHEDFGRAVMLDTAVELRRTVSKFCDLPVACDNRNIVLHVRQAGTADLIFAVNDTRKFGTYVGQWKRCLEEGVPAKGTLTINRRVGAVYDLVRHEAVPIKTEGRQTTLPLSYETCDGRVLLACEKPLGPLKIRRADKDAIRIETQDKDVMIPIGVFPANGRPRYGVLKNGKWTRRVPGGKIKVQNLATGEWYNEK